MYTHTQRNGQTFPTTSIIRNLKNIMYSFKCGCTYSYNTCISWDKVKADEVTKKEAATGFIYAVNDRVLVKQHQEAQVWSNHGCITYVSSRSSTKASTVELK